MRANLTEPISATRVRLLEAAGEVFVEQGFRAATVREICRRAAANVAAVNYHFRDKLSLYEATFAYWAQSALEKYPPTLGLGPNPTAEERLAAYVRSFLYRILDGGKSAWFGKLMSREMQDPTAVLDRRVADTIKPLSDLLHDLVRQVASATLSPEIVRNVAGSIVGQIVFYHHSRPIIARLFPELTNTPDQIDALAQHITRFSLAGLRELAKPEV
ncbi:MAG: CerR family C-terminal domain-containing protein [Planctomycetota bacterium]